MNKTKKSTLIALVIFVVLGSIVQIILKQFVFKPSYTELMIEEAIKNNKKLPMMMDENTRMDKMLYLANKNTMQYTYTLVNEVRDSVDTTIFQTKLKPYAIERMRTNPDMELARKHKTNLEFLYKDKNGIPFTVIRISADEYAQ